jgi:cyclophilin family peptidyl-prolyl cis-trans isomerase
MKRFAFIMSIVAAITISCGQNVENKKKDTSKVNAPETQAKENTTRKMEMKAENMEMKKIEQPEFDIITTHGTMRIRLYDKTPLHRDNFVKLVSEKYYDGIRFHRVIEGFMIQAGDPFSRDTALINKWGQGGPDYTVPAEFVNEYWHKKGALAAARKGDMANPTKASSGSQFYIVHDENACLHLDGQYTIFGEVIDGLDVIDKIAAVDVDRYDRPYEDVIINAVVPVLAPIETPEAADSTAVQAADSTKVSE